MKYPKTSKLMKEQRKIKEMTIYNLSDLVNVTASYLSQVENGNKLPSRDVFYRITYWLDIHTDNNFSEKFLTSYAVYQGFDPDTFIELFEGWAEAYSEMLMEPFKEFTDDVTQNKLEVKKNTLETSRIDKPYFDLHWLLTQNDYEVLYHRDYDIQNTKERTSKKRLDRMEKVLYNRLNDEDIKTIRELIEAYISNKYRKFPDKEGD